MADASPESKEKWLEDLLASDQASRDVDAEAYLIPIEGWAKSRHKAAARRAEDLLIRLERHFVESGENECLRPRVEHYNEVIGAWAGSQEDVSIVRAERWLNKLRSDDIVRPNTESYNRFLDACSKGRGKRNDVLENNAMKAEQVLKEMITLQEGSEDNAVAPNTESFNYVIRAWTRCRQDIAMAEKVMEMLRLMELYQRTGDGGDVKANTISYCMAIDAHGTVAGLKSLQSFRALQKKRNRHKSDGLDGGAITSDDNTADCAAEDLEKAASILAYMHDLADAGDIHVSPTTDAYNTYIGAYARTANEFNAKAPLAAEGVLRKMIAFRDEGLLHIQPDQRSYIQVMRAWARARRSNSGERAEWWLRNMWTEYEETENEKVRPNVGTYCAVMEAYFGLHRPNAMKIESLLLELLEHEKKTASQEDNALVANTAAFTFVIRGWLKHEEELAEDMASGCEKALHWLDVLMDREDQGVPHAATSPELYTGIIKAAKEAAMRVKTTSVSKRVLKTALEAFTEFRSSRHAVEPNAYAWIMQIGLKALSSPADDVGRTKLIRHLSKACYKDGYVSKAFVNALSNGPVWAEGWTVEESGRMTKEIFGDWPLPKSWSRNITRHGDIPERKDIRRSRFKVEDWHLAKAKLKAQQQQQQQQQRQQEEIHGTEGSDGSVPV